MPDNLLPASPELIKHFEDGVNNRLGTLNESKARYRLFHKNLAMFLIIFAALNTTVVTLSQTNQACAVWWGYLAIVLSTLVAILTGVNGLFKPKERQIKNAEALNAVFDVMARYKWRKLQPPLITVAELDVFQGEFRSIEREFFTALAALNDKES